MTIDEKNISALELQGFLEGRALGSSAPSAEDVPVEDLSSWMKDALLGTHDAQVLQRLHLAQQAVSWAKGVHKFVRHLLSEIDLQQIQHIDQLARRKYYSGKTTRSVQDAIFVTAPLGVLMSLIDEEQILEKATAHLRRSVVSVLETAIAQDLTLGSAELHGLIQKDNEECGEIVTVKEALEVAKSLQRLVYIVRDPDDLVLLYDYGVRSAHDIARLQKQWFVADLHEKHKMPKNTATRIHDHATSIDRRNQESWASILTNIGSNVIAGTVTSTEARQQITAGAKTHNLTDMFNLQFNQCDECCSVTGISAYFQDLMSALQAMKITSQVTTPGDPNESQPQNILEALLLRRPDLAHLELSCANASNEVPYIAIIIEVLESYIVNLEATDKTASGSGVAAYIAIEPFNEKSVVSSTTRPTKVAQDLARIEPVDTPREADKASIWQSVMISQMFPMKTFPYSLTGDSIATSLEQLGLNISEIVNIFSDTKILLNSHKAITKNVGDIPEVYQQVVAIKTATLTQACATLGLTPDDFLVITGQYPWAPLESQSGKQSTRPAAHLLWGYSSSSALLDTNEEVGTGLCFVRSQLLARTGLDFVELVELLQTLYLGAQLVLVNFKGSTKWEDDIAMMRLRVLDTSMKTAEDSKSIPATVPLTEEICVELQAFLRLRSKLGWSTADLDATISTLGHARVVAGESPAEYLHGISAPLLSDIACVVRLSKLAKISVVELLPLWGLIPTHNWPNSLYRKLFCIQALQGISDVFEPSEGASSIQPQVLPGDETIQKHQKSLQVAFGVTKDELDTLRRMACLDDSLEVLTLQSLSALHRYNLLCTMLDVTPEVLERVLAARPTFEPFIEPQCTLEFVETWRELCMFGWSSSDILTVITPLCNIPAKTESDTATTGRESIPSTEIPDDTRKVLSQAGLDTEDIKCLHGNTSPVGLNLAQIRFDDLRSIINWQRLCQAAQQATPGQTGPTPFHSFMHSLMSPEKDTDLSVLAAQLAAIMGWSASLTVMMLKTKYSGSSRDVVARQFLGVDGLEELSSLAERMSYLAPFEKSTRLKPSLFFEVAMMHNSTDTAVALQECLTEKQKKIATEKMRERKRSALLDYLLQLDHIRALDIVNSDGLFEHLLIDVQMGPQLQTTRTKQAVSTVQLFAQRCLLGREVANFVSKSDFRQEEWAWRQRHAVWQATRRVFLYPENWLEPTLRDSKTSLFREYEESITAQDLSWDTFVRAIKSYVGKLAAIADLEIEAYLCEASQGMSSRYHLFARTRNAPYNFYYRRLDVDRTSSSVPQPDWLPWTRMEFDMSVYETDWDETALQQTGVYLIPVMRKNRLFVLVPQISLKSTTAPIKNKNTEKPHEPITVEGLGSIPVHEMVPVKSWEVRLAWTELRDGKWTAKQLSQAVLPVAAHPQLGVPSIRNFVFELDSGTGTDGVGTEIEETKIKVGCWRGSVNNPTGYHLGHFAIRDDRVTAERSLTPDNGIGVVLPTTFHKYSWTDAKVASAPPLPPGTYAAEQRPLLAVPYRDGRSQESRTLTWSLSYGGDSNRAVTGMVVDETYGSGGQYRGATVFMWPSSESMSQDVKSDKVADNCNSSVMVHGNATRLLEASCASSGLTGIYDCIDQILYETRTETQRRLEERKSKMDAPKVQGTKDLPEKRMPFSLDFGQENWGKHVAGRNELSAPYAIYNWELGFHTIALAVDRFLGTQQFDLALRAVKIIFDPTGQPAGRKALEGSSTGSDSGEPSDLASCWRFAPFHEVALQTAKMKDGPYPFSKMLPDKASSDLDLAVAQRRSNPLNAHGTARGRTQAYMKWIVFKYIETLVQSGDSFFRQRSLETLPLAIQRYVEALYVLGPTPPPVPELAKARAPLTFATFTEDVDLELEFPFVCSLDHRGDTDPPPSSSADPTLLCLLRTTYFGFPQNPKYQTLRSLVQDRLYKTRNNLDIAGRPIVYSITEPYIDPGQLILSSLGQKGGAYGLDSSVGGATPIPFARFQALILQVLEMCNELRSMMEQLLCVREKRDGEALALLRIKQDRSRHDLLVGLKKMQHDEISITLDTLTLQRESCISQLTHYLRLIGEEKKKIPDDKTPWQDLEYTIDKPTSDHLRMNRFEKLEMRNHAKAASINESSAIRDGIIATLRMIPDTSVSAQPMGVGVTTRMGVALFANALEVGSRIDQVRSLMATNDATRAGRMNGLTRQLQERSLQANIKGREIETLNKQIAAQRVRLALNEKETELQQKERDWTLEIQTWYEQKYSSKDLYNMMEKELQELSFAQYNLALDLARRAETAFDFERNNLPVGSESSSGPQYLRKEGYWKAGGQFAAQQMAMDLRRMQIAYVERPCFDFQVTKTVSLRQLNPMALVNLQELGVAAFSLPEVLFDIDYPGHYMRRLKSVSVSIPAIVGPYTTIAGTLTLTEHKYRVTDKGVTGGAEYLAQTDAHFRKDVVPMTAVSISSGIQESGMFDLSFTSHQLGPFEGAGVVSSWKLELQESEMLRQFDYRTISDVVLHLRYTSLGGGPLFKKAAIAAAESYVKGNTEGNTNNSLFAMFDLQTDFSNEWHFMRQKRNKQNDINLSLSGLVGRMPFWTKGKTIKINGVSVVIAHSGAAKGSSNNYSQSVKVYVEEDKPLAWESTSSIHRATVLASEQVKGISLGDDWRLQLTGQLDVKELLLVLQYSV
jgi:hypothetical protein